MKRHYIISIAALLVTGLLLYSGLSLNGFAVGAAGQRKSSRKPQVSQRSAKGQIDYSKFSHATKKHQEACNTCHKVPTPGWQKARGFPDIADYPEHEACVSCHRQQFFKGARPVICTVCHTTVSPRSGDRFAFRHPGRQQQFTIEFPHDRHQDIIARLGPRLATEQAPRFLRANFTLAGSGPADQTKTYYNCAICHVPNTKQPIAPPSGWLDAFTPKPDTFKSSPDNHAACFNCHWKRQEPDSDDCAGCHKLVAPYLPTDSVTRISLKFRHAREQHSAECTTCHINITKVASLRGLKPDVPITSCTECHNHQGLRLDVSGELEQLDKNKEFVCAYCHTSSVGRLDAPAGHYLIAERPPIKRKDLK